MYAGQWFGSWEGNWIDQIASAVDLIDATGQIDLVATATLAGALRLIGLAAIELQAQGVLLPEEEEATPGFSSGMGGGGGGSGGGTVTVRKKRKTVVLDPEEEAAIAAQNAVIIRAIMQMVTDGLLD